MGKKIAVGMGEHLLKDNGIRPKIMEQICLRKMNKHFEFEDIPTNGLHLFKYFNLETEKIVVIDSAAKSEKFGPVPAFSPDQVLPQPPPRHMSAHEGDILKIIELGKKLLYPIPEIKIVVLEPDQAGDTYINTQHKTDKVIDQIIKELS